MNNEIRKLDYRPNYCDSPIKVSECGNVIELQYMKHRSMDCPIVNLPKNDGGKREYVVKHTGEIKECTIHDTRADSYKSLHRTFKRLRELINCNVTSVENVRWITLTYAENMTDTERLYKDFEKFNKRFQYYCDKQGFGKAEYIVVCEPQGRGAWHMHLMYFFDGVAPFISNDKLSDLWGHGFVKITALKDCDNVGAYLTAYLGDLEIPLIYCGNCATGKC